MLAGAALYLAHLRLVPQRIGDFRSHQARRVQIVATRRQFLGNIRIVFGDQPLDRHARIDHETHQ